MRARSCLGSTIPANWKTTLIPRGSSRRGVPSHDRPRKKGFDEQELNVAQPRCSRSSSKNGRHRRKFKSSPQLPSRDGIRAPTALPERGRGVRAERLAHHRHLRHLRAPGHGRARHGVRGGPHIARGDRGRSDGHPAQSVISSKWLDSSEVVGPSALTAAVAKTEIDVVRLSMV